MNATSEWKKYDSSTKRQIESHVDHLVTTGERSVVAQHCHLGGGAYGWLDERSFVLKGVTHFATINLPGEVDHE